jgi:hypothetical protein
MGGEPIAPGLGALDLWDLSRQVRHERSMLLERKEGNHSAIPLWSTSIYLYKHTAFVWKKNKHPIGRLYSSCGSSLGTGNFIGPRCA